MQETLAAATTDEDAPPRAARSTKDWWAAPAAAMLVVACCAGPLLLGALIASGAGGWLATHGFLLGGWAAFVVAAVLAGGPGCGTCRDDCRLFTVDRYEHGGRSGWLPRRVRRN